MRAAVTRSSLRWLGPSLLGLLTQLGVAIVSAQPLSFIAPRTDFPAGRGPFSVGVGAARQWRRNLRTGSGAFAESAMDTLVGGFTHLPERHPACAPRSPPGLLPSSGSRVNESLRDLQHRVVLR
jgi:hypothetical protein